MGEARGLYRRWDGGIDSLGCVKTPVVTSSISIAYKSKQERRAVAIVAARQAQSAVSALTYAEKRRKRKPTCSRAISSATMRGSDSAARSSPRRRRAADSCDRETRSWVYLHCHECPARPPEPSVRSSPPTPSRPPSTKTTMAPPDPTNAYAVPGPSRLPSSQPQHPRASTGAAFAAAGAAPRPSVNDGSRASSRSSSQRPVRKEPIRRADGPLLVKTVVAADGVREVPGAFEHCEVEDLINLICACDKPLAGATELTGLPRTPAAMLDRLIEHNDRIPLTSTSLTRFHSRAPPNISVRDYLLRIAKFTNVEACCLLILLPYVDKGQFPPSFRLPPLKLR